MLEPTNVVDAHSTTTSATNGARCGTRAASLHNRSLPAPAHSSTPACLSSHIWACTTTSKRHTSFPFSPDACPSSALARLICSNTSRSTRAWTSSRSIFSSVVRVAATSDACRSGNVCRRGEMCCGRTWMRRCRLCVRRTCGDTGR